MPTGALQITTVTTPRELETLRADWDELLEASGSTNPFLTWDWLAVWHEHLARGPLHILVARRAGELVGLVPFERVSYRLPLGLSVPTLQLIGRGSYQYELRGLICRPGLEGELVRASIDHLRDQRQPWYCAMFDGFLNESEAHREVRARVVDRSRGEGSDQFYSYVLDLPDSWEAFRARLKRNIKESLRRCYNSLAREGHTYQFEVWNEPERLPEALDRFMELHGRRAGQDTTVKHRNYFARPAELRFLHAVAPRLLARGILHPTFLRIDGEIVATRLALELNGQLYLYYSGFDERWWRYSVATTITAECIKWAIARGLRSVNLSVGKDVSKTRWGGRELDHRSVVVLADGWLPRVAFAAYAKVGSRDPHRLRRLLGAMPGAARQSGRLAAG